MSARSCSAANDKTAAGGQVPMLLVSGCARSCGRRPPGGPVATGADQMATIIVAELAAGSR